MYGCIDPGKYLCGNYKLDSNAEDVNNKLSWTDTQIVKLSAALKVAGDRDLRYLNDATDSHNTK